MMKIYLVISIITLLFSVISAEMTYKCSESDSVKLIRYEFEPNPLREKEDFKVFVDVDITKDIFCDSMIIFNLTQAVNCKIPKLTAARVNLPIKKALTDFPQNSVQTSCFDDFASEEIVKTGKVRIELNSPVQLKKGCYGGELKVEGRVKGKSITYFSCTGDGLEVVEKK